MRESGTTTRGLVRTGDRVREELIIMNDTKRCIRQETEVNNG